MIYLSFLFGLAAILLTHVVGAASLSNGLILDGVIRHRLPRPSGSLVLRGAAVQVCVGLMAYRPNRTYYRFAVVVG